MESDFLKNPKIELKAFRALIIDDDVSSLSHMGVLLHHSGWIVDFSFGGDRALKHVKARNFDLVIVDWMMPDLSGCETILAIDQFFNRRKRGPVPYVVSSGLSLDQIAIPPTVKLKFWGHLPKKLLLPDKVARLNEIRNSIRGLR
ncbi:MAG: PleD family two-component system response regulator [Bdellovibrionales bacterium]